MALWNPKLIPRKTLNAMRRTQTLDSFNLPSTGSVALTLDNCGVHPVSGQEMQAMPSGYRDRKIYKVYTTTPVYPAEEGTDQYADLIEVKTGIWCSVIKVEEWEYGLQSHYLAYVAEDNER